MLPAGLLRVIVPAGPWTDAATKLRPFVARRVPSPEIDDVMQDIFVRMQRGLPGLRDEERFTAWLFQVARSSIAEHGRARARHPVALHPSIGEETDVPAAAAEDDDREAMRSLSACVAMFVAALPSRYRKAVTMVELEGLTAREAAELAGISVSGMKSRVQRGRERLRRMFELCCELALDARGKVTSFTPRTQRCETCK